MFKQIKAAGNRYGYLEDSVRLQTNGRQMDIIISGDVWDQSKLSIRVLIFIDEPNCMLLIAPAESTMDSSDGSYKVTGKKAKRISAKNTSLPKGFRADCDWEVHQNGSILITYPEPKSMVQDIPSIKLNRLHERS